VLDETQGAARIRSVTTAADGSVTGMTLDAGPESGLGALGLAHRGASGALSLLAVSAVDGAAITLAAPAAAGVLAIGDLVSWGRVGTVTRAMLVKSITPLADLGARLELVDLAPGVWTADASPPASYPSSIAWPRPVTVAAPVDRPSGLRAIGGYNQISCLWSNPSGDYAWCELWVSESADRAGAHLLTQTRAGAHLHSGLQPDTRRWYWVRSVSVSGWIGPWSQEEGVEAVTRWVTFAEIEQQFIRESHLLPALQAKLLSIEELLTNYTLLQESLAAEVAAVARVRSDVRVVTTAQSATAARVDTIDTTVGDHSATIQTLNQSVDGMSASVTTKIRLEQHNGKHYVVGYGLEAHYNDDGTPTSEFLVIADRFGIGQPQGNGDVKFPFIVTTDDNGNSLIAMDTAFIADATIDTLHLRGAAVTELIYNDGWDVNFGVNQVSSLLIMARLRLNFGTDMRQLNGYFALEYDGQVIDEINNTISIPSGDTDMIITLPTANLMGSVTAQPGSHNVHVEFGTWVTDAEQKCDISIIVFKR